jgi:RNA polymerase sigma factor FliA
MPVKLKNPVGSIIDDGIGLLELDGEFLKDEDRQEKLNNTAAETAVISKKKVYDEKLVIEFIPLVHKIVQQVTSYLHPPLTRDDLVSAGTVGLIKAAQNYDPSKKTEFKTYAYIRVRGAVIDELRSWAFTPSIIKKQFDLAQQVVREYIEENNMEPSDDQLAERLDMTPDKMYRMFEAARARHFLSIHGINDNVPALGKSLMCKRTYDPKDWAEKEELSEKLAEAIEQLPEKQKQIILLYYHSEMTMKDTAEVMEITESRVSQLHAAALFKLSMKLKMWDETKA